MEADAKFVRICTKHQYLFFTLCFILILSCRRAPLELVGEEICACIEKIDLEDKLAINTATVDCAALSRPAIIRWLRSSPDIRSHEIFSRISLELFEKCKCYPSLIGAINRYNKIKSVSRVKDYSDCRVFRKGKFSLLLFPEACSIEMQDSIQICHYTDRMLTTKAKVNWINDCTYELVIYEKEGNDPDNYYKLYDTTKVTILETAGDTIRYEIETGDNYLIGMMVKEHPIVIIKFGDFKKRNNFL